MALDRQKIDIAKSYLRREYAGQLDDLKQYSRDVFALATDAVEVTTASAEGGSVGGQITFDRMNLLAAIEEIIAEWDATLAAPPPLPSSGTVLRFSPGCY